MVNHKLVMKRAGTAAIAVVVAAGLASCSKSSTAASPKKTVAANQKVSIAFLPLVQANPYIQATFKGIQEVAQKENASVTQFDGGLDGTKQQQQCTDAVASGKYQVIITVPVNPTNLVACAKAATNKGISFVNTDFPLGPDPSADKPQVTGQTASVLDPATTRGDWIFTLIDGACTGEPNCQVVLVNGVLADPYGQAVTKVVQAKAKASSNIKIVAVREGLYLPGPTLNVVSDLLQANPNIKVIATNSDPMTVGAEQAVKKAGKTGKIKLIGGGYSSEAPEAIKSGRWYGTFLSLPEDEGRLGADYGIKAARGESVSVGISASVKSGYPVVITKENIDKLAGLTPQWQGL